MEPDELYDRFNSFLERYKSHLAFGVLGGAIALQTYRSRHVGQYGGRGFHAAKSTMEQLSITLGDGSQAYHRATDAARNPVRSGFMQGIDPRPMPVAENYASISELTRAFYIGRFLALSNKTEFVGYQKRMCSFGSNDYLTNNAVSLRNRGMLGFGFGALTSSKIQSLLPIVSSPVFMLQVPWDAFHVLNDVAIGLRQTSELTENQRMTLQRQLVEMEKMGRTQMSRMLLSRKGSSFFGDY
jgi:hypothetical protein